MSVTREFFGSIKENESVEAITLSAGSVSVRLITLGAAIANLWIPDKNGDVLDVVCGYDSPEGYLVGKTHQGAVVGPVANRIAGASFSVDGDTYFLEANEGANCLHSGSIGFSFSNWEVESISDGETPSVCFVLKLEDGCWGFPGDRVFRAQYTLAEGGKLSLRLSAETDKTTPVNVTNHAYFNLDGYDAADVLEHLLLIRSKSIAELDPEMIPTGHVIKIKDTPYDFSSFKAIGEHINRDYLYLKKCNGYDVNYFLEKADVSEASAVLISRKSGLKMSVFTDQPCLQIYTANAVADHATPFKNAVRPLPHHAVCLEAQAMPDALHHPQIANILLYPGQQYEKNIVFTFEREEAFS